ncbi:MAG: hypothetical protein VB099_15460 [Candidatus Limiplasma sp.]|nr:hypothetical protein [Candidatus Limiplasma sp.]
MYLDPGFGSMIVQLLVAGIAVIGGIWFIVKKEVKNWFYRRRGLPIEEVAQDTAEAALSSTQPDSKEGVKE